MSEDKVFVWTWGCLYDPDVKGQIKGIKEISHEEFSKESLDEMGFTINQPITRVDKVIDGKAYHMFLFNSFDNAKSFLTGWDESVRVNKFAINSLVDRFKNSPAVKKNYKNWDLENVEIF